MVAGIRLLQTFNHYVIELLYFIYTPSQTLPQGRESDVGYTLWIRAFAGMTFFASFAEALRLCVEKNPVIF